MLNFTTLFNSAYLSRGLTMYESLKRHCNNFHLYIFAFDDKTMEILEKLALENITVISLQELEDEQLSKIKSTRSKGEYCWTCTPSTILYTLKKYKPDVCTYLDADIYFFSSPEPLLDELKNNSVIITEHRYSPEYYYHLAIDGKYCVQFVTFKNDCNGLEVLNWWRDRCIEWCYSSHEDGKFGDQEYLDDWLTRFKGIHELQHLGGGVAPWNVQQYDIYMENNKLFGREMKTNKTFDVIFYHFSDLRFYTNKKIILTRWEWYLSRTIRKLIYLPYIKDLESNKEKIQAIDNSFDPHGSLEDPEKTGWKTPFRIIKKILFKNRYTKCSLENFLQMT